MERWNRAIPIVGRILISLIFLVSGVEKIKAFTAMTSVLAAKGFEAGDAAVMTLVICIEIIGGLALLSGAFARPASLVLFLYLIPVTLIMHDFWATPPDQVELATSQFLKNLAIMGGLLMCYIHAPQIRPWEHKQR